MVHNVHISNVPHFPTHLQLELENLTICKYLLARMLFACWTMCSALRPGVFTMKRDISPPRPFINFYGERVRAGRGIPNSSRWSQLTQFLTEELGEERRGREELGEEELRQEKQKNAAL